MGIPEPPRLDPLCGAAALATCLRGIGEPYGKDRVLPNIRRTGLGSTMQDIVDAAGKLGMKATAVTADDKGLIALPKPLVAFVEHDHFIAVVGADKRGVDYLCSDCGAWPGGKVHLSWKQWHKLEATLYTAVYKPGSPLDQVLTQIASEKPTAKPGVRLASTTIPAAMQGALSQVTLLAALKGHLMLWVLPLGLVGCGGKMESPHCAHSCPMDCPGSESPFGASAGDPVNLATGEEEYSPAPDLTVYNPVGPSVVWKRLYNSLRSVAPNRYGAQTVGVGGAFDFGVGWSFTYNQRIDLSTSNVATLTLENGALVSFTPTATPSAANPHVPCTVPAGYPMLVTQEYNATADYFTVTYPDRTKWIFSFFPSNAGTGGGAQIVHPLLTAVNPGQYFPTQIIDRNGNAINLTYDASNMLSGIKDKNNAALLTISRTASLITGISDRYGRSVYYHVGSYATANVMSGFNQSFDELDHVSQIVSTGTATPPDRYAYGYQDVGNGDGTEQVPFLHTITVPSPTGTGSSTATINYVSPGYVSSLVDGNGNQRIYSVTDANHTLVTVKDPANNTVYSYIAGFDNNMSGTTITNGAGTVVACSTYADPLDPYQPSQVQDGNGYAVSGAGGKGTWTYTWDQFGNCKTATTPRSTVTTYTWSYANFALGEVTQIQQGSKSPISLTYYEPSGLIQMMTGPAPGTTGGGATISNGFTYDALGNVLTETGPGNNAATTITKTFNYTTDGTYTQSAAIRQPLTVTDNLGHVTHMRYDARGNQTVVVDALGNETDFSFNIANQDSGIVFAATTNTSNVTGHTSLANTYLYPDGPETAETQYNESGTSVWQVVMSFGQEGEVLSRTGSVQPYSQTYDPYYRPKTLTDGNGHITRFYFKQKNYLDAVTYPGYSGPTPVYNAATDSYDNITGADSVRFATYDSNGNITQRIDGRGVVTNLVYNDVESKLTDLQYPATTAVNVHRHYDAYGRMDSMTDGTGNQTAAYDDLDKKISVTTTYTGLPAQSLTYAYYPDGSRQSVSLPDGATLTSTFDGAARWTGLSASGGQTWSWSYLNNNWLSGQNADNTIVASPTRNARGFITDLAYHRTDVGQTLLSDFGIGYSPYLTVGTITSTVPAATTLSGTTTYTHDTRTELTQEQSTRAGNYTNSFAYDSAGNPTTFKGAANFYNSDNQCTSYAIDGNGNPTTYKGQTLSYDAENRLTAYGSILTAGYRGDGLRGWKQTSAGRTYYIYDGDKPVLEVNSSGVKTALNIFGVTGLLSRATATRTVLYTFDPQGNVSQQVDASSGTIVASYMFDAYGTRGNVGGDAAALSDPFSGFGGRDGYYSDWETGLELLGHRYYDPATGRFLTRDPISYTGGINLYECVRNSPLNAHDSSGFSGDPITIPPIEGEPPVEGIELPGLGECVGDLIHAVYSAAQGVHLNVIACQTVSNCLLSIGCGGLFNVIAAAINASALGIGAGALLACLAGVLCGLFHTAIDWVCEKLNPCTKDEPFNLCKALTNAAAGCLEGAASSIGLGWIAEPILASIEAGVEQWCQETFPG